MLRPCPGHPLLSMAYAPCGRLTGHPATSTLLQIDLVFFWLEALQMEQLMAVGCTRSSVGPAKGTECTEAFAGLLAAKRNK